jgi:hypothetical protein
MTSQDADAYAALAARRLGLTLSEAQRPAVTANLQILEAMAAEFADLVLDDDVDPAGLLRL